ncbi:MAG TPA: MerR family transcriptional regulator [bacterium]
MPIDGNFYLLKDLARLSGHSIYTLKYYLKLGLIRETGRSPATRFRYFTDATLERLAHIRAWQREGKRLAEIMALTGAPAESGRGA